MTVMSAKGLEVIDHTVQQTHEWVNELTERLDWASHREALRLLRVTLHMLRDHLKLDESAQFAAQLPLLIRGMYYEGWVPKNTPVKQRHAAEFVAAIETQVGDVLDYRGPEDITTVFRLLNVKISREKVADVRSSLPGEIRALWPED